MSDSRNDPRDRILIDVRDTITAHDDDETGWCGGEHDVPQRYPCQVRLWMEEVLERHARRPGSGRI